MSADSLDFQQPLRLRGGSVQAQPGNADAKGSAKAAKAQAAAAAAALKKEAAEAAKAEKTLRRQQSSKKWSFLHPGAPPAKPGGKAAGESPHGLPPLAPGMPGVKLPTGTEMCRRSQASSGHCRARSVGHARSVGQFLRVWQGSGNCVMEDGLTSAMWNAINSGIATKSASSVPRELHLETGHRKRLT